MANEKRLIDANTKIIDKYFNKRLISLDEALKATHSEIYWTESQQAAVRSFLVKQPKVDAVEVVHGRWENISGGMVKLGDCSECKVRQPVIGSNYCKNCGAKMDGDENG